MLIHREKTQAVNLSTALQLAVLGTILGLGLAIKAPGLPTAVVALQVSLVAQGAFMAWQLRERELVPAVL